MLRILLVDDEPLELMALRDHVDWKKLEIGEVLTAKNGRSAYELVLEREPDIVITDVHMPGMDGIALAQRIYEFNRKIKVVFLSGYDDFDYVKSAMRVGAVDYLLKPFTAAEIGEVIGRVKEALGRERLYSHSLESLEQTLIRQLCTGSGEGREAVLRELARIRQALGGSGQNGLLFFLGVSSRALSDYLMKNISGIRAVWVEDGGILVILQGYADPAELGRRIQEALRHLNGQRYSGVYLARRCVPDEELYECSQIVRSWGTALYYEPEGTLKGVRCAEEGFSGKTVSDEERNRFWERAKEELDSLLSGTEDRVEETVDGLLQSMKALGLTGREVGGRLQGLWPDIKTAENCRSASELRGQLLQGLKQLRMEVQARDSGRNAFVVLKVKEYVQLHYGEPMTVEAIAERIHLSVNYVRSIFKEGTGQTILEYVTDYRFEKACELLKNPLLRVKDVANRVGYENISYFGSVFTKRYHMTPNEYRKKFGQIPHEDSCKMI
ncbi:MAG: response regulator [Eubacteriales bacterium]|nr:response regulator [Eubacteriales bacterium]